MVGKRETEGEPKTVSDGNGKCCADWREKIVQRLEIGLFGKAFSFSPFPDSKNS
jgi:hypothetical protein